MSSCLRGRVPGRLNVCSQFGQLYDRWWLCLSILGKKIGCHDQATYGYNIWGCTLIKGRGSCAIASLWRKTGIAQRYSTLHAGALGAVRYLRSANGDYISIINSVGVIGFVPCVPVSLAVGFPCPRETKPKAYSSSHSCHSAGRRTGDSPPPQFTRC